MSLDILTTFSNFSFSPSALAIPIIASTIGWFTNWIAIKMLFYPRIKRNILGIKLHGVFPKRQAQLAEKLGELFAEKLGVQKQIENGIVSSIDLASLKDKLISKVAESAMDFLQKEMPFLVPMLPGNLINTLSNQVGDQLFTQISEEIRLGIDKIGKKVDVKKIVEYEINALKVTDLEKLLQDLLKKEFKFIELSGAILGFLIGCIQLALMPFI
jgi:uncharacterized membrane protein YheB (UPF0754 family)